MDIKSNKLRGIGFTDDGDSSILHRFTLEGVTSGVTAIVSTFDQPIYYALQNESFQEIDIKLETFKDIWKFYNVRLTMSFLFHEISDEVEIKQEEQQIISIPENDPLTTEIASIIPSRFNPVKYYPQTNLVGKGHYFTSKRKR